MTDRGGLLCSRVRALLKKKRDPAFSMNATVTKLEKEVGPALAIGDRGRWVARCACFSPPPASKGCSFSCHASLLSAAGEA
jgi:hypothetical protein